MYLKSGEIELRALRESDAPRLTGVYEYNTASQRVLEKCGYVKV